MESDAPLDAFALTDFDAWAEALDPLETRADKISHSRPFAFTLAPDDTSISMDEQSPSILVDAPELAESVTGTFDTPLAFNVDPELAKTTSGWSNSPCRTNVLPEVASAPVRLGISIFTVIFADDPNSDKPDQDVLRERTKVSPRISILSLSKWRSRSASAVTSKSGPTLTLTLSPLVASTALKPE